VSKDMDLKLQTLDYIFSGTKDYATEFHQLYVQPLLESGLTLEDSLAMLVEGVPAPTDLPSIRPPSFIAAPGRS
jgi:hypothetical protein